MYYNKHTIQLSATQRSSLEDITHKGNHKAREVRRAQVLLKSAAGYTDVEIGEHVQIAVSTVERIRHRYTAHGLERALCDAPRSGRPLTITDRIETQMVAIACTTPPEGAARWTMELLQERVIKDKLLKTVSTVGLWYHLTSRGIKPWLQKMWCIPQITAEFIIRMEDILTLYAHAYNPLEPVVCFDEKSKQLLLEKHPEITATPSGKSRRYDYEYVRNGTMNLFVSVEPKAGWWRARVTKHRKKLDFAKEIKRIVTQKRYSAVRTIHMVFDNLNTHKKESLVASFGEEEAERLWSRITPHYTPKHASWLNMAEIAISVLDRQCLNRRIGTEEKMKEEVHAWQKRRNQLKKVITWKFTVTDAKNVFKY
jgi:transposase